MNEKKYCLYCGKKVQSDSIFCTYCGQKIEYNNIKPEDNKDLKEKNTAALVGFIFSFTLYLTIPGFVISLYSLKSLKKYKSPRIVLSVIGLVVSSTIILFYIFLVIIRLKEGYPIAEALFFERE